MRRDARKSSRPWRPFIAEQVISVHEPGFVWLARMQAAPLLYAHILDCYVGGEGLLEVRLFGSLRLARAAGPQASRGELMRYLAELAWAPHAMLHNPHCPGARSMRTRLKCRRRARTARHGYGWCSRMAT